MIFDFGTLLVLKNMEHLLRTTNNDNRINDLLT